MQEIGLVPHLPVRPILVLAVRDKQNFLDWPAVEHFLKEECLCRHWLPLSVCIEILDKIEEDMMMEQEAVCTRLRRCRCRVRVL